MKGMNVNKILLISLLLLNFEVMVAQTLDLTSVDEFFKLTSTLKQGKQISQEQWGNFDNSVCYKRFAESENEFLINTIRNSIQIAFCNGKESIRDSILNISKEEMAESKTSMMKNLILTNYQKINENYSSIKSFRENYNFDSLLAKAIQRLESFLGTPIDSTIEFKPVCFFFLNRDGKDTEDALLIDFNFIYELTEQQRINFLAHEYFHNYRRYFENNDFNYKCDLNFMLDMIQNEGIADQIDKSQGYESYYSEIIKSTELTNIMVNLYNQAEDDLEKVQNIIIRYSKDEITENRMVDELLEVYKFNGHAIGFYMSNQIVKAGYRKEMIETFYNPYEFYKLYNLAAIENTTFQLSDEFLDYLKRITEKYYR